MTIATTKKPPVDWDTVIAEKAQVVIAAYHDGDRARVRLDLCRGMSCAQYEDTLTRVVLACIGEAEANGLTIDLDRIKGGRP